MGQEQHQFTSDKPDQIIKQKIVPTEYKICYEKWVADPNYLYNLMTENRGLTANILQFFPNARNSYQDFLEMVFFLQNYDPYILRHAYVKYNALHTTILDRFFMLMVKLEKFELLQNVMVNQDQMENLFIQFMKLFIKDPRKGFMFKVKKFIGFKEVESVSLKQFSANLREYFPHIQKHIKDYYTLKFKDMKPDAHLLNRFQSQILFEDGVILSMKVAELTSPSIKLLYEPRSCGMSFASIQRNLIGYTGPWLLIVEHIEKDLQGNRKIYKFGSFQSGPIRDVNTHQGDARGFLFELQPKLRHYAAGSEGGNYYMLNNSQDGKSRKGLGFGGNKDKEHFKLWIDQDIDKSTVYNGIDQTYGFGALLNPSTTNLTITRLQIWGLGTAQDQQNQNQYWAERGLEIQKRRKVNKAEFLQDAGMMFSNTFAHRDQVYGVIQRQTQKDVQGPNQKQRKNSEELIYEKKRELYYNESPPQTKSGRSQTFQPKKLSSQIPAQYQQYQSPQYQPSQYQSPPQYQSPQYQPSQYQSPQKQQGVYQVPPQFGSLQSQSQQRPQ